MAHPNLIRGREESGYLVQLEPADSWAMGVTNESNQQADQTRKVHPGLLGAGPQGLGVQSPVGLAESLLPEEA